MVYSYGECTTTGKNYLMKTFKVNNEPCHNETEWYYHVSKKLVRAQSFTSLQGDLKKVFPLANALNKHP